MTVQLVVFIIALAAVIFFFKNFNACVYFVVMVDIFLRIVSYLKLNYLKDDVFSFLNILPDNVLDIVNSFELGVFNEILIILYIVIYIVFEVLLAKFFMKRKF